jgi:hypothetical protein
MSQGYRLLLLSFAAFAITLVMAPDAGAQCQECLVLADQCKCVDAITGGVRVCKCRFGRNRNQGDWFECSSEGGSCRQVGQAIIGVHAPWDWSESSAKTAPPCDNPPSVPATPRVVPSVPFSGQRPAAGV